MSTSPKAHRSVMLRVLITASLTVIGLLLLSSLGIAYFQLSNISDHFKEMLNNEAPRSQIAAQLSRDALECRRYEKDLLLNLGDPATVSEYAAKWSAAHANLLTSLDSLDALAQDASEHEELVALKAQATHYGAGVELLIDKISQGQVTDPIAGNQELVPYKDDIRNLIETSAAIAERDAGEMEEIGADIRNDLTEMLTIFLWLTGVGLLFVVAMVAMIPGRFIRPLRGLQQAAERFAAGEFAARAPVRRDDELGQLAQSFNSMAATIGKQLQDLDQGELVRQQNVQLQQLLDLVQQLETPAIALAPQVLLVPLVGRVDPQRSEKIVQTVLAEIHARRASSVLIDITGLSDIDAQTTQMVERLSTASRLLGADVLITGISSSAARQIIEHSPNIAGVQTFGQLQNGLAAVLSGRTGALSAA